MLAYVIPLCLALLGLALLLTWRAWSRGRACRTGRWRWTPST